MWNDILVILFTVSDAPNHDYFLTGLFIFSLITNIQNED